MSYQIVDLIKDVNETIVEVKNELLKRKNGIKGDGSVQQLELIKNKLEEIKKRALTNNLPFKGERFTAFSRFVVDEWNTDSLLGKRLCDLADKYKRKLL